MLSTPTFPTMSLDPSNSFKSRGISTGTRSFPIAGSLWPASGASYGWIGVGFVSFQWEWKSSRCRIWLVASPAQRVCAQGRPIDVVNPLVHRGFALVDGRFAITNCLCTSFSANEGTRSTTSC
ncbi:uncharacterized protein [Physcomitrium patens]|uniref:uncharacterized protein isoform X1 n=1 Tax=Physcomitrium patens TaxID=3218 RepID=UPI000D153EAC|nr:uncharacterized protein LOC112282659 isoform X2 [Physcomitrium patens]|eukprot:XP_024376341.1 uncharacterized protein LOC112282659 isoform X2 [Physcomitrella patens]